MANGIIGTLPVKHSVDHSGSFSINIPLQVPQAKVMPEISLAYHSAANSPSAVGLGWVLKGASLIERVPATIAQDGFRGVINYDEKDRFALDGQRLIKLTPSGNEYRFELEQWSKIIAQGDPRNPDSWVEHLPDGTTRIFGATTDSNIKAQGGSATRVWAISEHLDAFANYALFSYNNDTQNGSVYLTKVTYGGNRRVTMAHQREVALEYEDRPDKRIKYVGGYKICVNKRLASITSRVQTKIIHRHLFEYDTAPLTATSRLRALTLANSSGETVRPLKFDWVDGQPSVFDPVRKITTISAGTSTAQIMPMDVNATGRSDFLIASKRLDSHQIEALYLAVHKADGQGNISQSPSPGSGFTGLRFPTQLIPLDINGDGKMDLLHIVSSVSGNYALTVLLSTPDGYKSQQTVKFEPESMKGRFYSGDFEGTGYVGLVYVYQVLRDSGYSLKFTQFTSDGTKFTALNPCDGPKGVGIENTNIVVGDLNGKGADDVFIISSKIKDSRKVCHINLLESAKGRLGYRTDEPLVSSGESILWTSSTTFLPYAADGDGKASLLVVSRSISGHLQWQLLRSTGPSFLPPLGSITTQFLFSGHITLAKTSSTYNVDLVNTSSSVSGVQVQVLRFNGEIFVPISAVRQPEGVPSGSSVRWADLRGVGRADCTLNTFNTSGEVTVRSMPCSSSQPVDFISGYENGLGAKVTVLYASLSDPETYTATDAVSKTTAAATNAMAHNVTSSASLGSSSAAQKSGHSRTELVHFPAFVVKTVSVCPRTSKPDVLEHGRYTYKNARLAFDGRGWLGFESITKTLRPLGICEVTSYHQSFPLLGQASQVTTSEEIGGHVLQVNNYTWKSVSRNNGRNQSVLLQSGRESYYEGGAHSYAVDVSYQHDPYANVTQLDIQSSQPNVPTLTIQSAFDNDERYWVIGSKTLETVKQRATVLKQTKYTYATGTQVSNKTSNWVAGSFWSTQNFELDLTGNEKVIKGPGPSRRSLAYDETYSNIVSASTFTGPDAGSVLKETATYDLALGKPLSVTNANGHTISWTYDVLGRVVNLSEGTTASGMTVVEKHSFHFEGGNFFESRQNRIGSDRWSTSKAYLDGFKQTWKTERPRPDDPSAVIYCEVQYDGAGRVVARSQDYLAGSTPVFSNYTYDTQSRIVKEVSPAVAEDVSPVTTTFQYKFESGLAKAITTRSHGETATDQVIIRELLYLPNSQPSAGKFVKPFVTRLINELGQNIQTLFDGLGRSISVKDPSNVELSLGWDGLSRQITRRISKPGGGSSNIISHLSVKYEDDLCQNSVINELTGTTVVTKTDFVQRPVAKTTADETFIFTYDKGGEYPKDRLVSVTSSKGINQHFDYDILGHLARACLSLDGHTFVTSHEWTPSGQPLKTTNPDGTTLTRSLLADGETVQKIELADATQVTRASVALGGFDNVFSRPLVCEFGNGIKATSSIAHNGLLTNTALSHGESVLHQQHWGIDPFSRIEEHKISHAGHQPISNSFRYNTAGQLMNHTLDSSAPSTEDTFSYDHSGNLCSRDGKSFIHDGWQLTSMQNQQGATECTFKYSVDGNLTAKLDGNGAETSVMKYDSSGRLVDLDSTAFVYDFGGRLIKSVLPNGDITIYPSQTYELSIPSSGEKSHTAYLTHGYRRASLTTKEEAGPPVVYYFHSDHLGNTVAVSSENGETVTRYMYDPFGKVAVEGPDVARYKFSGKEQFGSLYYFGARFYDPDTARFLTLDDYPTSLRQITPSTFNMYAFSRNDPINFVDLNGNVPWWHWVVDAALIVAGAVVSFIPIPGMSILGGALLGAGIGGLVYDFDATVFNDGAYKDSEWGLQLGIGAVLGLASGGVGAALDALLPPVSIIGAAAARGVASTVSRIALRTVVMAGVGSGTGVLGQLATNAEAGKPLDEGLLRAAVVGAITGGAAQLAFEGIAFMKPALKIWKGERQWGNYNVAFQRNTETVAIQGLRQTTQVQYPMAQVGSEVRSALHGPSSSSSFNSASCNPAYFDPSSMAKYLPAHDITSL